MKVREAALQKLTASLVQRGDAVGVRQLLADLRPTFSSIPKAKTAKMVRQLLDSLASIPDTTQMQLELCKEQSEWAKSERRTFLRQRIDTRLVQLYLATKEYTLALSLISTLSSEVKRIDDKVLLVDIHLLESKIHFALRNIPKAKAALTAARTAANAIYVPPSTQSQIDVQAGILHADEKDYKTAYSYFFEAFEQLNALEDTPKATQALKYVLLTKIMNNQADDVTTIITSKGGLKYTGLDMDAMQAVADAYTARSLSSFEASLAKFAEQLDSDAIVKGHVGDLYDTLLEQNLLKIVEPFSNVEVAHVASLIGLDVATVERKLSQMILDKKLTGTLDQGEGCLIVFDEVEQDKMYDKALTTIGNMSTVVDSLFTRSSKIVA